MDRTRGNSDSWFTGSDRLSHISSLFNDPTGGLFTYFYAHAPSVSLLQKLGGLLGNPLLLELMNGDGAALAEDMQLIDDEQKVGGILQLAENCMYAALKSGESCD